MELRDEIDRELRRTNLSRNRYAYLIQLIVLIFSLWYQTRFSHPLNDFIIAVAVSGCMLRFFATEIISDDLKGSDTFLWLGFFLLSMAWTLHIDQSLRVHGLHGDTIPLLRVTLGGLIISNTALLVADVISYYIFLLPVTIGIILEIFFFKNMENSYPLLNFFVISVLSSLALHFHHKQLRALIGARIEAMREKSRLKRIIDGVPGFVAMISESGVYFDANSAVLSVYPNLVGTKIGELTKQSEYSGILEEFLRSDKEALTVETNVIINGETSHLMTTMGRLPDGGMIVCSIPINELVETRKELREQEAVAMYSSKLASVGQMAAGVAHEVNNPLAIIQGSASIIASIIEQEPLDKKNLKIFSDKIINTSNRIAQIIKSLRSLSRGGDSDPFAPLSVKGVINSCLDISRQSIKNNDVKLIFNEGQKELTVMGREVQLGQVVLNLLINAIDATKALQERWIQIDYGHTDGQVWIEVVDSGLGIPAEVAGKIMEPFFTTKDKDEGTGLGLSISTRIIEDHAGKLEFLPDRKNTTFRLFFPTPKL